MSEQKPESGDIEEQNPDAGNEDNPNVSEDAESGHIADAEVDEQDKPGTDTDSDEQQ